MNRTEKEKVVSELKETFCNSENVIVVQQSGLTVSESTAFRSKCRELNVRLRVAKNRLVKIALNDTNYSYLDEYFVGTTAIAYSEDPLMASKAVFEYAKSNEKVTILAGGMGNKALTSDEVKQWGALPSLDELRGKLVGLLQAPGSQIARVCKAYSEKS